MKMVFILDLGSEQRDRKYMQQAEYSDKKHEINTDKYDN
jgi:hypothetical protein